MAEFTYQNLGADPLMGWDMIKRSDGAMIPGDPANTDYQAYLKWLETQAQQQP